MEDRGWKIKRHWDLIEKDTDIVIVPGPPYKILDKTITGYHTGCSDLLTKIKEIKPKLCVFGHIHEANGSVIENETLYINASVLDENYKLKNKAYLVEVNEYCDFKIISD